MTSSLSPLLSVPYFIFILLVHGTRVDHINQYADL
jgi:hypothetical protein